MSRQAAYRDPTPDEALRELAREEELAEMVPVAVIQPIIEEWLDQHENAEQAFQRLAIASGLKADTWRKRFSSAVHEGRRGTWRGWWSLDALDIREVDFVLAIADLTHLWHTDERLVHLAPSRGHLSCADCGKPLLDAEDYRPLELFREDPGSLHGWVRDTLKNKWVYRPKNARAGGRRFQWFDLCRKCSAVALAQREGRDRNKPPKRGGRPRLLNDQQLRQLYVIYERGEKSQRDLARMLSSAGHKGTVGGLAQSIMYGWRRLDLQTRSRAEVMTLVHRDLRGHEIGRRAQQTANKRKCKALTIGTTITKRQCGQWAQPGSKYCAMHNRHGLASRSERRPRCAATAARTKRGCTFSPLPDSQYCRFHDERFFDERSRKTRQARQSQKMVSGRTIYPLLLDYLEWLEKQPATRGAPRRWHDLAKVSGCTPDTFNRIYNSPDLPIRAGTRANIEHAVSELLYYELKQAA